MALATYKELFEGALEEWIGAGGVVSQIVTLVNAYQKTDATARHFLFQDWIDGALFDCGRCGKDFGPPEDVEEEDYVLCFKCANR